MTFGLLTRNIHRWAAHLMVFFVFLHMMRVFYHGAYKPPREFNWVVGVVLLFVTVMLSFTGYLLPWDQIAYWAITIGSNMGGYVPVFNTPTKLLLLGGLEVGQNTLLRFYVLHIMVFPLARRGLPGGPLLAHPQGRRDLGAAMTTQRVVAACAPSLTHLGVRALTCSASPSAGHALAAPLTRARRMDLPLGASRV